MNYPVVVHKSEYGYDVHCPLLPGCHSQGDTVEEALENIKDAIKTYLENEDLFKIKKVASPHFPYIHFRLTDLYKYNIKNICCNKISICF